MKHITAVKIILYVQDQAASRQFYSAVLRRLPELDVEGMTEFRIRTHCKLGLMPNNGIAKVLSDAMPHPATGTGIPRCELYLGVEDVDAEYGNAVLAGAKPVSAVRDREWGHRGRIRG